MSTVMQFRLHSYGRTLLTSPISGAPRNIIESLKTADDRLTSSAVKAKAGNFLQSAIVISNQISAHLA